MERPDGISKLNWNHFHVGIVGRGKMGTSLFNFLLDFEFPLVWICKVKNEVEELNEQIRRKWVRTFRTGIVEQDRYEMRLSQIGVSHLPQDLVPCNLIIEAITEDLVQKKKLFNTLDRVANRDCIFASSSSSIPPEDWYSYDKRKDKVIGMHFFYPVPFVNIVELILTRDTSQQTVQIARLFLNHLNKKFMLQQGESAFLLNRVFLDFQAGAYRLCKKNNLAFSEMDKLIIRDFFPVGVFEFFDRVGIDVIHNSIDRYTEKANNREFYQPLLDHLSNMIRDNRLGMKTGQGFYTWEAKERVIQDKNNQKSSNDAVDESITSQLKDWYVNAARRFVKQGYCTEEELTFAVKEYMNCESGPFEMDVK